MLSRHELQEPLVPMNAPWQPTCEAEEPRTALAGPGSLASSPPTPAFSETLVLSVSENPGTQTSLPLFYTWPRPAERGEGLELDL